MLFYSIVRIMNDELDFILFLSLFFVFLFFFFILDLKKGVTVMVTQSYNTEKVMEKF